LNKDKSDLRYQLKSDQDSVKVVTKTQKMVIQRMKS